MPQQSPIRQPVPAPSGRVAPLPEPAPSRRAALSLAAGALLGSCTNPARDARTIKIGAMQPGTSWYVFGVTLAELLGGELGDRIVEVVPRGGGVGNPILVSRGDATVALAQAATSAWAFDGDRIAFGGVAHPRLRAILGGLNSVWMSAMLREEYIRRTGNDTLEKALLGNPPARIVVKPAGSTIPVLMDILLAALGSSRADLRARGGSVAQVGASQIASLLRDGFADLYFEGAIRGHPTMTEITSTAEVRFLELPETVLRRISRPGVTPGVLPKWFPRQHAPLRSVDMGTVLICRDDLPADTAALIARVVCEHRERIVSAHKAWLDFRPEQAGAIENTGIPLHPGAAEYLRGRGWA
jgi:TRAP transporter TAXI family solute receptor